MYFALRTSGTVTEAHMSSGYRLKKKNKPEKQRWDVWESLETQSFKMTAIPESQCRLSATSQAPNGL